MAGAFFFANVGPGFDFGFVVTGGFALGWVATAFVLDAGFFFAATGTAVGITAFLAVGFLGAAFAVVFVVLGLAFGLGVGLAAVAFAFGFAAIGLDFAAGFFLATAGIAAAFTAFLTGNSFGGAFAAVFFLISVVLGFATFSADVFFGAADFETTTLDRFLPADFFGASFFKAGF